MHHPLQCRCGTVQGYVGDPKRANRCVCYCRDCQAFAHFLGRADEILDANNGTDVIQTIPANVTFTQGREQLACLRLTPKGLLRWYCMCCNTPIGNTLATHKMSFIGLIHTCLGSDAPSLDESFGPVRMWVNTDGAKSAVEHSTGKFSGILRVLAMLARARLDGSYKQNPFFAVDSGAPVVTPRVLSRGERDSLFSSL